MNFDFEGSHCFKKGVPSALNNGKLAGINLLDDQGTILLEFIFVLMNAAYLRAFWNTPNILNILYITKLKWIHINNF